MKRVFINMDNVLVDFQSGLDQVSEEIKVEYSWEERNLLVQWRMDSVWLRNIPNWESVLDCNFFVSNKLLTYFLIIFLI